VGLSVEYRSTIRSTLTVMNIMVTIILYATMIIIIIIIINQVLLRRSNGASHRTAPNDYDFD